MFPIENLAKLMILLDREQERVMSALSSEV